MTQEELREMYLSKQSTVRVLNALLDGVVREWQVEYLQAESGPYSGSLVEYIRCYGPGGDVRYINVAGTSEGAIVKEICRELYGNGAIGRVPKDYAAELEDQWYKGGRLHGVE